MRREDFLVRMKFAVDSDRELRIAAPEQPLALIYHNVERRKSKRRSIRLRNNVPVDAILHAENRNNNNQDRQVLSGVY